MLTEYNIKITDENKIFISSKNHTDSILLDYNLEKSEIENISFAMEEYKKLHLTKFCDYKSTFFYFTEKTQELYSPRYSSLLYKGEQIVIIYFNEKNQKCATVCNWNLINGCCLINAIKKYLERYHFPVGNKQFINENYLNKEYVLEGEEL